MTTNSTESTTTTTTAKDGAPKKPRLPSNPAQRILAAMRAEGGPHDVLASLSPDELNGAKEAFAAALQHVINRREQLRKQLEG